MTLGLIFGILGLILDIIGVSFLFFLQHLDVEISENILNQGVQFGSLLNKGVGDEINKTYHQNKAIYQNSKKWFLLVFLGFIFQIISLSLSAQTQNNAKSEPHTEARKNCKHNICFCKHHFKK